MKTFKEYCRKNVKMVIEQKMATEAEYPGMVGIHELMTDDKFLNWFEKLSDKILNTLTMYEIYQKYKKEVLRLK
jgi:hypothetical protein